MGRDIVFIHGWFRNTEILFSIHGGARRADKEPSHHSEAIKWVLNHSLIFTKQSSVGGMGDMGQLPTPPARGGLQGGQGGGRANISHAYHTLWTLLQQDAAAWCWVDWRDFFFRFKPFSLRIFGPTMLTSSSGRQCVAPSHSALGPLVFLFA